MALAAIGSGPRRLRCRRAVLYGEWRSCGPLEGKVT
jgi:hypothetical protein